MMTKWKFSRKTPATKGSSLQYLTTRTKSGLLNFRCRYCWRNTWGIVEKCSRWELELCRIGARCWAMTAFLWGRILVDRGLTLGPLRIIQLYPHLPLLGKLVSVSIALKSIYFIYKIYSFLVVHSFLYFTLWHLFIVQLYIQYCVICSKYVFNLSYDLV